MLVTIKWMPFFRTFLPPHIISNNALITPSDLLRWPLHPPHQSHPVPFPQHQHGMGIHRQGARGDRLLHRHGQDHQRLQVHVHHRLPAHRHDDLPRRVRAHRLEDQRLHYYTTDWEPAGVSLLATCCAGDILNIFISLFAFLFVLAYPELRRLSVYK